MSCEDKSNNGSFENIDYQSELKSVEVVNDKPNRLTRHRETDDQTAILKNVNEFDQQKTEMQENQISKLTAKLDKLKEELDEVKANYSKQLKIGEQENVEPNNLKMDGNDDRLKVPVRIDSAKHHEWWKLTSKVDYQLKRQKAVAECSIGDMAAFLESPNRCKVLESEVFYCDGLIWSVVVYKKQFGAKYYLSVNLVATNPADDNWTKVNWSSIAAVKITLLNSRESYNACMGNTHDTVVFSNEIRSLGWEQFIGCDELKSMGYIKNDEIKFQVDLHVKNARKVPVRVLEAFCFLLIFVLIVLFLIYIKM